MKHIRLRISFILVPSLFLLLSVEVKAEDPLGFVSFTAVPWQRTQSVRADGILVVRRRFPEFSSVIGSKFNDVRCSVSVWEPTLSANPCPSDFTVGHETISESMMVVPPLTGGGGAWSNTAATTSPLQFFEDYTGDIAKLTPLFALDRALPTRTAGSEPLEEQKVFVGEIKFFFGSNIPVGWLPADGRTLHKDQFSSLYAAIGNRYSDNSTPPNSFQIPLISNAVIYKDGTYKTVQPLIRAENDGWGEPGTFIGDVIISANPNLSRQHSMFVSIDGGTTTRLAIQQNMVLYYLVGNTYGTFDSRMFSLPHIVRNKNADTDVVSFYLISYGMFPNRF